MGDGFEDRTASAPHNRARGPEHRQQLRSCRRAYRHCRTRRPLFHRRPSMSPAHYSDRQAGEMVLTLRAIARIVDEELPTAAAFDSIRLALANVGMRHHDGGRAASGPRKDAAAIALGRK